MPEKRMQSLKEYEYEAWDSFVEKAVNGTIFHKSWWYRAWGVDFEIYARKDANGEIEAGMPVFVSHFKLMPKILGVKGLTRPPLTLVNGPLFLDTAKAGRYGKYAHAKRETLGAIASLPEAGFYDILLHRFHEDLMPYIWNGFDTQVYYTYIIPKEEAAGPWRGHMADTARRSLRKAHETADAGGFRIETEPPLEDIVPLFTGTAEENGYSMKRIPRLLPKWWEAVRGNNAGRAYVLRDGAGLASCASLAVWDTRSYYFMMGGMRRDARKGYLNMLLFERMIEDAGRMGLDFDFEGSILIGVEKFFRGWGGKLYPCFRVTKAPSISTYLGLKGYRYLKFHRNRRWVDPYQEKF